MKKTNLWLAAGVILLVLAMFVSCTAVDPVPPTDPMSSGAEAIGSEASSEIPDLSGEAAVSSEESSRETAASQSASAPSAESRSEAAASAPSEETANTETTTPSEELTSSEETAESSTTSSLPSLEEMFPEMDPGTASMVEEFLNSGLGSPENPLELPEVEYVPPSGS